MKKHRLFVAINLPQHLKQKLVKYQQQWTDLSGQELPVRWTKEHSLHITLVFIGHVDDQQMLNICQKTRTVAQKHQPFSIELNKIELGPPASNAKRSSAGWPNRAPRMIWASGRNNDALAKLRTDLENSLSDSARLRDSRAFSPHITLARIRPWQWKQLEQPPKIDKELDLSFGVDSIEVMSSQLLRSGAEYSVLESVVLGD